MTIEQYGAFYNLISGLQLYAAGRDSRGRWERALTKDDCDLTVEDLLGLPREEVRLTMVRRMALTICAGFYPDAPCTEPCDRCYQAAGLVFDSWEEGAAAMTDASNTRWADNRRIADGMAVVEVTPEHWVVVPPDGRPRLAYCPCCAKPFAEARFACNAADVLYPPQ